MCESLHPLTLTQCRVDGPHPDHLVGYGKNALAWPNPDFRPLVQRIPKNRLVELAKRTREYQAERSPCHTPPVSSEEVMMYDSPGATS